MITKITGEQPFQVLTSNFSISPSSEGYTLQISADGTNFSNLFTVGAGVTRLVTGVAANSYYRLSGNQSKVSINWMKTCVTEGGGNGTELQPVADFPLNAVEGTVISYTGSSSASGVYQYDGNEWTAVGADDLSAYWTSAQTEDAISAATSGKADAANIQANVFDYRLPSWNKQGIVTGALGNAYTNSITINGVSKSYWGRGNGNPDPFYAPLSAGTAGEILVSAGDNQAPVWTTDNKVSSASVSTIWKGTQAEYDAITTKDPNTFYIIVSN